MRAEIRVKIRATFVVKHDKLVVMHFAVKAQLGESY